MLSNYLLVVFIFILFPLVRGVQPVVVVAKDAVRYIPPDGGWGYSPITSTFACGGDYMYSLSNTSEITIPFTGIAIALNLIKFDRGGRALIEIDGFEQTTVDTYSSTVICDQAIFTTSSNLTDAPHRIRISDATHNAPALHLLFKSLTYIEYTASDRASTSKVASSSSTTPSSPATATSTDAASQRGNAPIIAGGVVGGILGVLVLVAIAWSILRRQKRAPRRRFDVGEDHPSRMVAWTEQSTPEQALIQPQPQSTMSQYGAETMSTTNLQTFPPTLLPYGYSSSSLSKSLAKAQLQPRISGPGSVDRQTSQCSMEEAKTMPNLVGDIVTSRVQDQLDSVVQLHSPGAEDTSPTCRGSSLVYPAPPDDETHPQPPK